MCKFSLNQVSLVDGIDYIITSCMYSGYRYCFFFSSQDADDTDQMIALKYFL